MTESTNDPGREAKEFRAGAEHMVDMLIHDAFEFDFHAPVIDTPERSRWLERLRANLIQLVLNAPYRKTI